MAKPVLPSVEATTSLGNLFYMNERTRRVNVQYKQTKFVNRETDG